MASRDGTMTDKGKPAGSGAAKSPAADRKARLAEELRANLQKRKAQIRSRRTGEADQRADGLAAAVDPAGAAPEAGGDAASDTGTD